ncbi:alpha-(1,3)-fucosyltransferase fut-5-like [Pomacea canaliculata]|uniref:alpha-(1,3)-fucosyltransferase fut-5-like n=1 Tax=Pomacea canaliculata TaxID=400727 RepID=UPI000D732B19|nr:alpha-(1,3)-fucosyltransferase fut-5-like [Pomacea canaliculata]
MNEKRIIVLVILACAVLACEMVIYIWYISSLYSLQFLPVNISVSQIMSAVSDTEETQLNKSTRLNVTNLYPGEVMVSTSIKDNHKIISSRSSHGSFPNITSEQSTNSPVQKLEKNFSLTLPMLRSYITHHMWPVYNWTGTDVKSLPNKTIMFHNIPSWLQANGNEYFKNCEVSACSLTSDTKWRQSADAIFYHVSRLNEDGPPEGRPPGQIWIAYGFESPVHSNSQYRSPGWKNVFNWTITYRQDSDLFSPYATLTRRNGPSTKNFTQVALEKTKSVAWFVSNCHTPSKREVYVKRMQKVISVDIFGECGSQQCGNTCNDLLNKTYRFYLPSRTLYAVIMSQKNFLKYTQTSTWCRLFAEEQTIKKVFHLELS